MSLALSPLAAAWFLPFVLPVCLWVAWSDMARMKIPNAAVLALAAIWLLLGPWLVPLPDWGWGWARLAGVLAVGFVLNMGGALGAVVGYLYDGTLIPLLGGGVALALMSLAAAWWAEGGRLFGAITPD